MNPNSELKPQVEDVEGVSKPMVNGTKQNIYGNREPEGVSMPAHEPDPIFVQRIASGHSFGNPASNSAPTSKAPNQTRPWEDDYEVPQRDDRCPANYDNKHCQCRFWKNYEHKMHWAIGGNIEWLDGEEYWRRHPESTPSPEGQRGDKSEGVKMGAFGRIDPSPFPVDEEFTIYLDDESDFVIQSQRETGLIAHGNTPEEAVYNMREVLDMAASLGFKPEPLPNPLSPQEERIGGFLHELSTEKLLEKAVRNARSRSAYKGRKHPRWTAVMDAFALGSTYAHDLCRKFGLDPDEEIRR